MKALWLLTPALAAGVAAFVLVREDPVTPVASFCGADAEALVATTLRPPASLDEFNTLIAEFRKRAAREPENRRWQHQLASRLAIRYQALGDEADLIGAQQITEELLRGDAGDQAARVRASALALAQHDFETALTQAHRAVDLGVTDAALAALFDAQIETGDQNAARATLTAMTPGGFERSYREVRWFDMKGDSSAARAAFDRAIRLAENASVHPLSLANLYANSAVMHMHSGERGSACAQFQMALQHNPQQAAALEWLARDALAQGHTDDAAIVLQRMLQIRPNAPLWLHLATLTLPADDPRAAALRLRRDELLNADSASHRLLAARLALAEGRPQRALDVLARETSRPRAREVLALTSAAQAMLGDTRAAEQTMRRVSESGAMHPPLAYLQAGVMIRAGKIVDARVIDESTLLGAVELLPDELAQLRLRSGPDSN